MEIGMKIGIGIQVDETSLSLPIISTIYRFYIHICIFSKTLLIRLPLDFFLSIILYAIYTRDLIFPIAYFY